MERRAWNGSAGRKERKTARHESQINFLSSLEVTHYAFFPFCSDSTLIIRLLLQKPINPLPHPSSSLPYLGERKRGTALEDSALDRRAVEEREPRELPGLMGLLVWLCLVGGQGGR